PGCLDYVAHGPFAATGTKTDAGKPVGTEGIEQVRALTTLPLMAIGGIDATNTADAISAGADGVAVVSAIMAARDPAAAARVLNDVVTRTLAERPPQAERREALG
ncbi:MAG: thiamine phosphate synthase, partial [Pseudomonadota bacterium]